MSKQTGAERVMQAAEGKLETIADGPFVSEVRDGMRIDWDVPVKMADGTLIRLNVYRPTEAGTFGTVASSGVYGKDLAIQDGYTGVWKKMIELDPHLSSGSTNNHVSWEVVDPERWVPDGYAVVRIDARGTGTSDGYLNPFAHQEARDFAAIIEWVGRQPWSNGKVGVAGVSYLAMYAWRVAALRPKCLKAIAAWEGALDNYRDATYHGGIRSRLGERWYPGQVTRVQRGLSTEFKNRSTGQSVTGPAVAAEELIATRYPFGEEQARHPLDGPYHDERSTRNVADIECAVLSSANWGGQGLHLRGNIEGFLAAGSREKFLEVHGLEHWTHFVSPYGESLLKRFFGHYLQGKDTGWAKQPPVQLNIRHPNDHFELRAENEWPLARTRWTRLYLDPGTHGLGIERPKGHQVLEYDPLGSVGITFSTAPLTEPMEITGPSAAKLFVSSVTTDADLFLVLRVFDPQGREVLFRGTADPNTPVAQGWLRASHRKLDVAKSRPERPFHPHDELQPLVPGKVAECDVEIWPTSIVIPKGYRLALTIRGKDFDCSEEMAKAPAGYEGTVLVGMRGCGPFVHDDPTDRPPAIFGGRVSLHFAPGAEPYVLLPVIPAG